MYHYFILSQIYPGKKFFGPDLDLHFSKGIFHLQEYRTMSGWAHPIAIGVGLIYTLGGLAKFIGLKDMFVSMFPTYSVQHDNFVDNFMVN